MSYRQSFLNECNRFSRLMRHNVSIDPAGLQQFYDIESKGVKPQYPHPHCMLLLDGKKWWEWQLNEMAALRFTDEWPGWLQWRLDFLDDPAAFRQLVQRCSMRLEDVECPID